MKKDNLEISLLLDFYGEMLTYRQKEMLELYYDQDLSLAEISAHVGIQRQGVLDAVRRAENQLFDMESKLKLVARFAALKDGLTKIKAAAEEIYEENRHNCYSDLIGRDAAGIVEIADKLQTE